MTKCLNKDCKKTALYGRVGSKKAEYCVTHKSLEHIDLVHKSCEYKGCKIRPHYGKEGSKKAEYCASHKLPDYINVLSKRCIAKGCSKQPTYGKVGSKKAEYCIEHKLPEYVDVKSKRCIFENCYIQASYGKEGSKKAEYCATHKLPEYVDIKNKTCLFKDCKKLATYGKKASKKAEYCATHKLPEYVDIKNKVCIHEKCCKQPIYGKKESKKAEYCIEHKLPEYVDVRHKICKHDKCKKRAYYGLPNYSEEYCVTHKLFNMIREPTKAKNDDFKECSYCLTKIHYSLEFCQGCFTYQKLGTTVKQHEKELAIKVLLDENKIDYIHDIIIKDGCSRKRPDFRISTKWGNIILEVDEFQHKRRNYTAECEMTRMKQIYFDSGVEQLLFIRYNPDDYKTNDIQESTTKRQEYLIKLLRKEMNKDKRIVIPNLSDSSDDSSDSDSDDSSSDDSSSDNSNEDTNKKIGGIAVIYLYYDNFAKQSPEEQYIDPYKN